MVFGPLLGGHVRLWQDEGPATYWRVRDPETFRRQVGIGTRARSMVDTNRYREAGLFDAATGTLLLPGRYGDPDQGMPAGVAELTPVAAEVALSAITEQVRQDFARWFGAVAVSAAQRGEFVALETGGFTVPMTPYVLALVVRAPDGSWVSHVETSPTPRGAPVWRDQPQNEDSQQLRAPARRDTVAVAGVLADAAIRTWPVDLFGLGLSFGQSPDGPCPG